VQYYTLTDFRGIWALLRQDGPQVFQYRVQHQRWDEAPWHLPAILGFGDAQGVREVTEISEAQMAKYLSDPPDSVAEFSDGQWALVEQTQW
jgi:hypothetical protein